MTWKVTARDFASPLVHPLSYTLASWTMEKIIPIRTQGVLMELKNRKFRYCQVEENLEKDGNTVLGLLKKPAFLEEVDRRQRETVEALLSYARPLRSMDFGKKTNKELGAILEKLFSLFTGMNCWGHLVNLADFEHQILSNKILAFLRKKAKDKIDASEAFSVLITPNERSRVQQHDYDLYSLLALIQEDEKTEALFRKPADRIAAELGAFPELKKALAEHVEKYDWMSFQYDGPTILGLGYFLELLTSEERQGTRGAEKIREMKNAEEETATKAKKLAALMELDAEEMHWLNVAKTFMFLKTLRKEAVFDASRCSDGLLAEISKRINLSRVQARHMTIEEIKDALRTGKVDTGLINERVRHSIWTAENGKIKAATGKEAGACSAQIVEENADDVDELKGTTAYPGRAKGTVKIIEKAEDMAKMRVGDVLVSPATNPNIVSAMKKAAAIVTDEGGVTCHAAIVSRELGIPCVIGTKIATKWLKDGDFVEVDATQGVVRKVNSGGEANGALRLSLADNRFQLLSPGGGTPGATVDATKGIVRKL